VLAVALALALAGASRGVAARQIIGGSAIQVQSAPWTVFIRQTQKGATFSCTGSILDSLHVLTAAHCMYDDNGVLASITTLTVRAGISNITTPLGSDSEQDRTVSSFRQHPGYPDDGTVSADDVAILALNQPLDLSGLAVKAVALPGPGFTYPAGAQTTVAGFGRESPSGSPDGSLNSLSLTVDDQGNCGGRPTELITDNDAVMFCAIPASGATCNGDSGAGLVTTATATPVLVGVLDAGPVGCGAGWASFAYLGAPEILQFVQGTIQPPVAPRRTADTTVQLDWNGALRVGNVLTCTSSNWDGSPTISYAFVNSQNGQVLQQGSAGTYTLKPADIHATLFCRALASNNGGVATTRTTTTAAVGAGTPMKIASFAPVSARRGRPVTVRVVVDTPQGLAGRVSVCVAPIASVGSRACAHQRIDDGGYGGLPFNLRLRIKPSAPAGSSRLSVTATSDVSTVQRNGVLRVVAG
jgi:elastase-2